MRRLLPLILVSVTACAGGAEGVDVPGGFEVAVVVDGLEHPTQIAVASDDRLLVAQLAGGENDSTGQVISLSLVDPDDRVVIFDGLDKPTGVAEMGGHVWVMQRRSLGRGPMAGGDLEIVLGDLPFNGRSEGTLTPAPDGRLLFDTSGALADGVVVEGSGTLWSIGEDGSRRAVATGFKHAYGHVFGSDDTLWTTEVSDGSYDGSPARDELLAVDPGTDHGWPRCVGNNRPVSEFGASPTDCVDVPGSLAVFEPGATPTSVAAAPWDETQLLVALWNRGTIVSIDTTAEPPVTPEVFLTGIDHPQHLLVVGPRLLVVDFDGGRVLAVSR